MRRRRIVIHRVEINAVIDQNWLLPHFKNLFINNQLVDFRENLILFNVFFCKYFAKSIKNLQKILCFFMLNTP